MNFWRGIHWSIDKVGGYGNFWRRILTTDAPRVRTFYVLPETLKGEIKPYSWTNKKSVFH